MKCNKCKKKEALFEDCGEPIFEDWTPKQFQNPKDTGNKDYCLHKNCAGCRSGTCSGVHMLSCPCKNCSPIM